MILISLLRNCFRQPTSRTVPNLPAGMRPPRHSIRSISEPDDARVTAALSPPGLHLIPTNSASYIYGAAARSALA